MPYPDSEMLGAYMEVSYSRSKYTKRTEVATLMTANDGKDRPSTLGFIKWHAPWRKYAFFPNPGTTFDANCMTLITQLIGQMMQRHTDRKAGKIA